MAVIPSSHLSLCRARKELMTAFEQQNWGAVGALDTVLGQTLTQAAEDPQRDTAVLLSELGQILKLYRELVTGCQEQVSHLASS